MVKGPLRGVLWVLGGLGVLWVVLVPSTTIGMLGLAGVFVHLVVDPVGGTGSSPEPEGDGPAWVA